MTHAAVRNEAYTRPIAIDKDLASYRPPMACYLHTPMGIHGLGHASRVLVWANLIAHWMRERGVAVDLNVVCWSATLHDVRRLNDGKDPGHGARCGAWIHHGASWLSRTLSHEQRQSIAYCCTWHVPPDSQAPVMTPELICLKDADALDRVRLGGLDTRFLRTDCAKALVKQAQFLCDTSEMTAGYCTDQWLGVQQASERMCLWTTRHEALSESRLKHLRFLGT